MNIKIIKKQKAKPTVICYPRLLERPNSVNGKMYAVAFSETKGFLLDDGKLCEDSDKWKDYGWILLNDLVNVKFSN